MVSSLEVARTRSSDIRYPWTSPRPLLSLTRYCYKVVDFLDTMTSVHHCLTREVSFHSTSRSFLSPLNLYGSRFHAGRLPGTSVKLTGRDNMVLTGTVTGSLIILFISVTFLLTRWPGRLVRAVEVGFHSTLPRISLQCLYKSLLQANASTAVLVQLTQCVNITSRILCSFFKLLTAYIYNGEKPIHLVINALKI